MHLRHVVIKAIFSLTVVLSSYAAEPENRITRLARDEPEILLATGGRTGICDVLSFSKTGDTLYAVGEDKVIHRWSVADNQLRPQNPLYWNTFRERRGSIYALALHEDALQPRLAIGGFGKLDADVAVYDARSGELITAISPLVTPSYAARATIWALAFSPSGRELAIGDEQGNLWLSQLDGQPPPKVAHRVKSHTNDRRSDWIVWVGYLPSGQLAYAQKNGQVSIVHPDGQSVALFTFSNAPVDRVVSSRDGKWIAATPQSETAQGSYVELRSLTDFKESRLIPFPRGRFPDRIALSNDGSRLAVGVAEYGPPTQRQRILADPPGTLEIHDPHSASPRLIAVATNLEMRPDALAFHPDGTRLASAGGYTHATTLWAIANGQLTRISEDAGKAVPLWGVRMSADGRYLAFQTQAAASPTHPNARGAGDWKTFDLERRDWIASSTTLVPPTNEMTGWQIEPDSVDVYQWFVRDPSHRRHPIPLNRVLDDRPLCYTFLPAEPTDPAGSVRFAIGHYWGLSLFTMVPGQPPQLIRKLTGHVGPVISVAPALRGQALVSCGRDNVIAVWNLGPFPSQPTLGASFVEENGQVIVRTVDTGSPAEEAGLNPGDRLVDLAFDGRWLPQDAWLERLRQPIPGKELAFKLQREKVEQVLLTKTSVYHRPVARFLPTRDDEWVLYTYRQCYYDCSTNGDRYIQWLVSKDRADKQPDVYSVDRFAMLHRPDKVADVIRRMTREPCQPILPDLFPPDVTCQVVPAPNDSMTMKIRASVRPRPRHDGNINPIERVELWVNGHYRAGVESFIHQPQADKPSEITFSLPFEVLRAGSNEVRAVAIARDAGIGVSRPVRIDGPPSARTRKLYGVSVGINQYQYDSGPLQNLTCAVADARRFRSAWSTSFPSSDAKLTLLTDDAVTRDQVLTQIRDSQSAGPDDLFVLFLAGHGALGHHIGGADEWYYLIPRTSRGPLSRADWLTKSSALRDAFLRDDVLFDALAALKCQTIVVLDCCHSGASATARESLAATTRVRSLRPYGYGPIVVAACSPSQSSFERDGEGFFTSRVVRALGTDFAIADSDQDQRLSAAELYDYVRKGVAKDVEGLEDENQQPVRQTPQIAPPVDELDALILVEPTRKK